MKNRQKRHKPVNLGGKMSQSSEKRHKSSQNQLKEDKLHNRFCKWVLLLESLYI